MATNQRSILLQRAMRAEQARKIAEEDAARSKAALIEAHAAIRRLTAAAALAADLTPAVRHPTPGMHVQLVRVREAVHDGNDWKCPHTGERIQPTLGTYWRELENSDEL
jgi:hypothetical protein